MSVQIKCFAVCHCFCCGVIQVRLYRITSSNREHIKSFWFKFMWTIWTTCQHHQVPAPLPCEMLSEVASKVHFPYLMSEACSDWNVGLKLTKKYLAWIQTEITMKPAGMGFFFSFLLSHSHINIPVSIAKRASVWFHFQNIFILSLLAGCLKYCIQFPTLSSLPGGWDLNRNWLGDEGRTAEGFPSRKGSEFILL